MAHLKLKKGMHTEYLQMSPRAPDPRDSLRTKLTHDALRQLTRMDATTLNSMFEGLQFQGDQSAPLNEEKFATVMATSGHPVFKEKSVARSFFRAMDSNGNGHIDQKELMIGLMTLATGTLEDKLKLCFRIYDINKDGSLEEKELVQVLRAVGCVDPVHVAREIFKFDLDGNGVIDLEEFVAAAKGRPDLQEFFVLEGFKSDEKK